MAQTVITILEQVFTSNPVVPIMIQLPESAVENVKVLVGKVTSHLVYVFFLVDLMEGLEQVRPSDLTRGDAARMALVDNVEDASNDRDGVLFLKLSVVRQELKALGSIQDEMDEENTPMTRSAKSRRRTYLPDDH